MCDHVSHERCFYLTFYKFSSYKYIWYIQVECASAAWCFAILWQEYSTLIFLVDCCCGHLCTILVQVSGPLDLIHRIFMVTSSSSLELFILISAYMMLCVRLPLLESSKLQCVFSFKGLPRMICTHRRQQPKPILARCYCWRDGRSMCGFNNLWYKEQSPRRFQMMDCHVILI